MPIKHELHIEGHTLVALEYNADKGGTPAFLIHGIMSSVGFWQEDDPIFRDQFHWFALSLPGHYPARLPDDFQRAELTAETIARLLTAAIRQLVGDQPVLLVGHSTGGFAALAIAAHTPAMARGVVSIAGFAQGKWGGLLSLLQWQARRGTAGEALFRMNVKSGTLHPLSTYLLSSLYAADRGAYFRAPGWYQRIQRQAVYTKQLDTRAMTHYFNRMPDIDITDWLPRITAPVLVISGDRDPIVPPTQAALIASTIAGAQLVLLAGAGHMLMLERAAQYTEALTTWLQPFAGTAAAPEPVGLPEWSAPLAVG